MALNLYFTTFDQLPIVQLNTDMFMLIITDSWGAQWRWQIVIGQSIQRNFPSTTKDMNLCNDVFFHSLHSCDFGVQN